MSLPSISEYEIENQFLDFLRANNLAPADNLSLSIDGQVHRYRVQGDRTYEQSGAYCVYPDGSVPCGWAEDWHVGQPIKWRFDTSGLPQEQQNALNRPTPEQEKQLKELQEKRKQEREQKQLAAADRARVRIDTLSNAPENHPYLRKKHIAPHGVKVDTDNRLAVPLQDINGIVRNLQWIAPDSTKRFYPDAPLNGSFWSVGLDTLDTNPQSPILLGEGYATMAKIFELTGYPCVAAMNCHALADTAKLLKGKYPERKIICMADNDKATELKRDFNPGILHAQNLVRDRLAQAFFCPEFENPDNGSDWDDYAIRYGDKDTAKLLKDKISYECMSEQEKREFDARKLLISAVRELNPSVSLPPQEFVGGLWPRGYVSLLIAPPGTGKTIFVQKFVSDLSVGGSIFDGFAEDEPAGTSLIMAGEAGYELLVRRGASMKWPINPKNVKVLDQYDAELKGIQIMIDNQDGWYNVLRLVDIYKPDVVFFDTFSSFHDIDENKATEMKPLFKRMAALARQSNIAVVPVHHSRKRLAKERTLALSQDDVIGSSISNRLVGLIIGIEPLKDDEKILLVRPLKSWFSSFMPFTYTLKESMYGGTVVKTDLAPAVVGNSKAAVLNYLLTAFRSGEWFTRSQIVLSHIDGNVTDRMLRSILTDLVKTGQLSRRGSTKNTEYALS